MLNNWKDVGSPRQEWKMTGLLSSCCASLGSTLSPTLPQELGPDIAALGAE